MQKLFKKLTLLALLLMLSLGATTSEPNPLVTPQQARERAFEAAWALRIYGYDIRDRYNHGFLRRGQSTTLSTTLYAGNDYVIIAGGCYDAYDIDVTIYDENYNVVDRDTDADTAAGVEVSPRWTGTFYIKVTMYNSTRNGAHWALVYGYK